MQREENSFEGLKNGHFVKVSLKEKDGEKVIELLVTP
jgi:hypothetical protein